MPNENTTELSQNTKRLALGIKDAVITIRELLIAILALLITIAGTRKNSKEPIALPKEEDESFSIKTLEVPQEMKLNKENEVGSKTFVSRIIYPILATASTISLIVGVIKITPIAQWAKSQNNCIENSLSINGSDASSLSTKVKNCNGGHD